jgi:KaiC/GvpD/RAD55 family RecA-like ATPase
LNDNQKMKGLDANDIQRMYGGEALVTAIDHAKRTIYEPQKSGATPDSKPVIGPKLVVNKAANIKPEKIDWVWPGRLARGKHTAVAGEPGTGKSQLSIAVIATVTTGGRWPCDEGCAPLGNAVILSAEDGAGDTIVPRLMAAEADLDRVHIVSAVEEAAGARRTFNLQRDLQTLERQIEKIGNVALVVIDPVSSYLGKVDSHNNSDVRSVLEPLSEMAERKRVAILSLTHFSKGGQNATKKALDRFIGSVAFTGAPRAAFAVIGDPDHEERRLFLSVKNNLARTPQGLAYRLEQRLVGNEVEGIVGSRIMWESEPVTISANEALAADSAGLGSRTAKAEAIELLETALDGGPLPARDIRELARDHGITEKAIRMARGAIGVKIERDGFGPGSQSVWSLPKAA